MDCERSSGLQYPLVSVSSVMLCIKVSYESLVQVGVEIVSEGATDIFSLVWLVPGGATRAHAFKDSALDQIHGFSILREDRVYKTKGFCISLRVY